MNRAMRKICNQSKKMEDTYFLADMSGLVSGMQRHSWFQPRSDGSSQGDSQFHVLAIVFINLGNLTPLLLLDTSAIDGFKV